MRGNADGLTKRQLLPAKTVFRSRELRKEAGAPERVMLRALRAAFPDARFRHQAPFGPYHADICSHGAKLIVEIDGDTHADPTAAEADARRTRFLNDEGYRVIRFWNNDVMESLNGVIADVARHLPDELKGALRG